MGTVISALITGLVALFAIVIGQGIVAGQDTAGWPTVLTSILTNITPVIGIIGIIAMFLLLAKVASAA
jgi:hypothetical protein